MKRAVWTTGVASLAALALLAVSSEAYNIGYYTHSSGDPGCASSSAVDPINFVFYSWGTTGRVDNQLLYHGYNAGSNWNYHDGSHQNFYVNNICSDQYYQYADCQLVCTRTHFREQPVYYESGTIGWSTVTDAHHEQLVGCGHAVDANGTQGFGNGSGYDYGQFLVYWQFYGTSNHTTFQSQFFNTQIMRQCNGWLASDNGYAQWMQLHQVNH